MHSAPHATRHRLRYQPPLALDHTLQWLSSRLIQGVEAIEGRCYYRLLATNTDGTHAWFSVRPCPELEHTLELKISGVVPERQKEIVRDVRRMFDLDTDPLAVAQALQEDPRLAPLIEQLPGLRIPGAWDGFETAMRAVIGQQVSVAAAHTITQRVMQRVATPLENPPHPLLTMRFDGTASVLSTDLSGLGLTGRRIASIQAVAQALREGRVNFEIESTIEDWLSSWTALPGIGPWTASYLALRGLSYPDVFPGGDLVLRKALALGSNQDPPTPAKARALAECWRPWRSYAAFYLWYAMSNRA